MTEQRSFSYRLKYELTDNLAGSVLAVGLAVVAFFAFGAVGDRTIAGVLLALNIAVFIPYAYERYWPEAYATGAAVVWTVSAAFITSGLFIGTYQLLVGNIPVELVPGMAFVVTVVVQYGTAALFAHVRRRA